MNRESIQIIIQARMGSARLPGKSLAEIGDRPSLGQLLEAVKKVFTIEQIVVATSTGSVDDAIFEFVSTEGVRVFRGDELNVASRFLSLSQDSRYSHFVRLNGDSPALDYRIFEKLIAELQNDSDLVTTVGGGYPSGMNVELIKSESFRRAYERFSEPRHFEHVTKFFYENPTYFKIRSVKCDLEKVSQYKFSVDTLEDLERMKRLFGEFEGAHTDYSLTTKCQIYERLFS